MSSIMLDSIKMKDDTKRLFNKTLDKYKNHPKLKNAPMSLIMGFVLQEIVVTISRLEYHIKDIGYDENKKEGV